MELNIFVLSWDYVYGSGGYGDNDIIKPSDGTHVLKIEQRRSWIFRLKLYFPTILTSARCKIISLLLTVIGFGVLGIC